MFRIKNLSKNQIKSKKNQNQLKLKSTKYCNLIYFFQLYQTINSLLLSVILNYIFTYETHIYISSRGFVLIAVVQVQSLKIHSQYNQFNDTGHLKSQEPGKEIGGKQNHSTAGVLVHFQYNYFNDTGHLKSSEVKQSHSMASIDIQYCGQCGYGGPASRLKNSIKQAIPGIEINSHAANGKTGTIKVSWNKDNKEATVWNKGRADTQSNHAQIIQLLKQAQ